MVLHEYCLRYANSIKRLPNIFDDDDTENYVVEFDITRKEDIFTTFLLENGYAVYKTPTEKLAEVLFNSENPLASGFWNLNDEEYYSRIEILKDLYEASGEPFSLSHFPNAFPQLKILTRHFDFYEIFNVDQIEASQIVPRDKREEIYNGIYTDLLASGKIKSKWKSEYMLYETIVKIFPDAIYQYHAKWLGKQSLDIYVPSLKMGFEYQGIQHYSPVEHFGGEETYIQNVERDQRKRLLCKQQGVTLIEYKFTESINTKAVLAKIKTAQETMSEGEQQ